MITRITQASFGIKTLRKYYVQVLKTIFTTNTDHLFWCADEHGYATRHGNTQFGPPIQAADFGKTYPDSRFYEVKLGPGEYYPRIARPSSTNITDSPGRIPEHSSDSRKQRAKGTGQLHALIGQFEQIYRVIHPEGDNFKAFGHETRNLLMLACTEVETQWKGILKANNYENSSHTKQMIT